MSDPRDEVTSAIQSLYREVLEPLGRRFAFESRPSAGEIAGPPSVLVLGNHSSGKSSFINHLLGSAVQRTGLAPTDDSFTILAHGDREQEWDGHALASNPDLPYEGLRAFGPELLSHLRLKRRPAELLREVTLIDSPGMIDAAAPGAGRGYDFAEVVRWFALRADVVILFFDPDKPGTTGETLDIVTRSLSGLDHKLLIVMNKMDMFRSLSDFARCYGALCWNLGKVIPRKDLPHIFTTFVPVETCFEPALPAEDFVKARQALEREVRAAPERRVDNMLTQLEDYGERLFLHATLARAARSEVRQTVARTLLTLTGAVLLAAGFVYLTIHFSAPWWMTLCGAAALVLAILHSYGRLRRLRRDAVDDVLARLPEFLDRRFARERLERGSSAGFKARIDQVLPRLRESIEKLGPAALSGFSGSEAARLRKLLEQEVPALRSRLHAASRGRSAREPALTR